MDAAAQPSASPGVPPSAGINDLLDTAPMHGAPRSGARRFWTTRELALLREHYPTGGVLACLPRLPGRSARAVYGMACKLRLPGPDTLRREGRPRQRYSTSPQIDDAIRRGYPKATGVGAVVALAQAVGRPRWWVSRRAAALGLVAPRFRQPPWTDAEAEIVAGNAHRSPATIVRKLRRAGFERTETAVAVKVKRLGADTTDPDHWTARGFAAVMGVDSTTVSAWIAKGWLQAKRRGTERTAAQGGDQWWIHRKAARRFVLENLAAVDLRKVEKYAFVSLLTDGAA